MHWLIGTAAFLATVSSTALSYAAPAFESGVQGYGLGNQPGNVNTSLIVGAHAAADFDGDGYVDVVHGCSSGSSPKFSILFSRGDGSFDDAVFQSLPLAAPTVAAADLDGDGDQDLAFARWEPGTGNQVYFYRNGGSGTFVAPTTIVVGSRPRDIGAADLDLDGDIDLVTVNESGSVSILRNTGSGSFLVTTTGLGAGSQPLFLALGDLTADGRPDLAFTEAFSSNVHVLFNSNGSFVGPATLLPLTGGPGSQVVIEDFDGDADNDIIYARGFEFGFPGSVECFRNNGAGSFSPGLRVATITELVPNDVAVGDFNADGIPDLVAAGMRFDLGSVVLVPGLGGGSFGPGTVSYSGRGAIHVSAVDVDNDGRDDVVSTNLFSQSAKVFRSGPGGIVQMPAAVWFNQQFGLDPIAGDLDNDGDMDALLAESSIVSALLNDGAGNFTRVETPMQFLACTRDVHLADMNGDGILDLLATRDDACTPYRLLTMRGRGDGTFDPLVVWSFAQAPSGDTAGGNASIATLDWDHDGDLDVTVTETLGCASCDPYRMFLFDGNGQGGFTGIREWFGTSAAFAPYRVYAGDFDEDGHMDLVSSLGVTFIRGYGDGTFAPPVVNSPALGATWLAVGDVNQDAHLDVAYVSIGESGAGARGGVTGIMLGDGAGNFTESAMRWGPYDMNYIPEHGVALGDVTGDGLVDVVAAGTESCDLLLFRGDGLGGLQKAERYGTQGRTYRPIVADFTGDGILDVGVGVVATMPIADSYFSVLPGSSAGAVDVPIRAAIHATVLGIASLHPNPTAGSVGIRFTAPPSTRVDVRIFDVRGRLVDSWKATADEAGDGNTLWNGTRREGSRVAPGVYFAHVRTGADPHGTSRKFVVLR